MSNFLNSAAYKAIETRCIEQAKAAMVAINNMVDCGDSVSDALCSALGTCGFDTYKEYIYAEMREPGNDPAVALWIAQRDATEIENEAKQEAKHAALAADKAKRDAEMALFKPSMSIEEILEYRNTMSAALAAARAALNQPV